jgi:hypothetical protein
MKKASHNQLKHNKYLYQSTTLISASGASRYRNIINIHHKNYSTELANCNKKFITRVHEQQPTLV